MRDGLLNAIALVTVFVDAADVPWCFVRKNVVSALREDLDGAFKEAVTGKGFHGDLKQDRELSDVDRGAVAERRRPLIVIVSFRETQNLQEMPNPIIDNKLLMKALSEH